MPFVPNGEFVTSAWFCAGVPVGGPQQVCVAVVANPSEVALTGKITTFTDAAGVASTRAFEVPAPRTTVFDLVQMQPAGHVRFGDGRDLRWRWIRRTTCRQRIGSAVSPCSNSHRRRVLCRRIHGRGSKDN